MSFRLALTILALLAPLAALPAVAQDTMHNSATTPNGSGMSDTGMSHASMSKSAMAAHGKSHGTMNGGAMASHSMSHGDTMAPSANSAPHA